jgi:hypothetical protein
MIVVDDLDDVSDGREAHAAHPHHVRPGGEEPELELA